jgi:hypothetical protein
MSCGHDPVYTYTDWVCDLSKDPECPVGYVNAGMEYSKRAPPNFCLGDLVNKVNRKRRKCRLNTWKPALKLECCLGTKSGGKYCAPEWCPNSQACDETILEYCSDPANFDNPICGCALPASQYQDSKLFGPPECVDKRCATNPKAHRLSYQKNPTCNITNCVIGDIDISGSGAGNIDIEAIKQQCGNKFKDLTGTAGGISRPGKVTKQLGGGNSLVWAVGGIAAVSLLGMIATRPK